MVEDDQVVMMDEEVDLADHLVVNASHRQAHHHLVLVVNEMVCETDHHLEESRDAACVVRQAWEHLEGVVMKVVCSDVQADDHHLGRCSAEVEDPVEGRCWCFVQECHLYYL